MAGWRDFREIAAWQLANQLKVLADEFLARPEGARRFAFCSEGEVLNHFVDASQQRLLKREEFIRARAPRATSNESRERAHHLARVTPRSSSATSSAQAAQKGVAPGTSHPPFGTFGTRHPWHPTVVWFLWACRPDSPTPPRSRSSSGAWRCRGRSGRA
jgi:hypothetical protein